MIYDDTVTRITGDRTGVVRMENPFLNRAADGSDYLTPSSSINRVRLAKLPVYGVDDEIEGLTVKEFFSAKLIRKEIKKNADALHIDLDCDEKKLPRRLAQKSEDESDVSGSRLATDIIRKFGGRLGLLLLALKLGESENRAARADWTDAHWEYLAGIEDIVLVGGLASGRFGEIMKARVNEVFALKGVRPYNILLYNNASQVAVLGCASCIKERDGAFVVMDFGQTGIKRSCVIKSGGEIAKVKTFETLPSILMEWETPDCEERLRQAKELHGYLTDAVGRTFDEAKLAAKAEPGGEVVISVASYTVNGALDESRGGYAKLCALGKNYAELLSEELSGRLRRSVSVRLIHDGTAVALNFRDRKNTLCLSVGSYFGVGFPDTRTV